ncbi:uncharacterized protein LOC26528551 isoform X1 [Drosophila mojavensis]|uniref:Uncharacterized protein, isoform A n=1 Tax=Drosophila mojavensis TaxID=7230 RepID=A0A0Q9XEE8_DROMO|nr:uncharacterized protein LOC26528551 isoform X1 [Drosophila mojavensis]KRG06677.1 uncharacterized protein Dmoj_GI26910, isoform A [Drosophila mojavensis]
MQVLSLLLLLFASGTVSGSYGENGKISGAGVDSSNKLSSKLNEGYRFKGIGSSKVGNQVEVVTIAVSVIRTGKKPRRRPTQPADGPSPIFRVHQSAPVGK